MRAAIFRLRRLVKTVRTTTTRFVNDISSNLEKVLVETNTSNVISNYYVYGIGLISQEGGAAASARDYLLEDGEGNIRLVMDENRNKINYYTYQPYGGMRSTTLQTDKMLYQGQQIDTESGLYHLRARQYDPIIGRFISVDPVKGYLKTPQTQNPYAYSWNNPVNLDDPSGKDVYNNSGQHIIAVTEKGGFEIVEPNKTYQGNQDGVIFQDGTIYKNNNGVNVNAQGNNLASPANLGDSVKNLAGDVGKIGYNAIPGKANKDLSGYYKLNDGTSTGNWNPGSAVSYIQTKNTGSCFKY